MTRSATNPETSWAIEQLSSPADGLAIRYATLALGQPKRGILLLNGRSEFIEKYMDIPEELGYTDTLWVTMDHRGQGASDGLRSHVDSYELFAKDVQAVAEKTFGDLPYVAVCHSMGGLIAMVASLEKRLKPKAMVLSSPLFGLLTPMPLPVARVLAKGLSLTKWKNRSTGAGLDRRKVFADNTLTSDETRFERMKTPLFKAHAPTFGWVNATFQAIASIHQRARLSSLKIPMGIMVGSHELVVNAEAYQPWIEICEGLTGRSVPLHLIQGGRHELLNERDPVRREALTFIRRILSAVPEFSGDPV